MRIWSKPGTFFHVWEIGEGEGRKWYKYLRDVGGHQRSFYPNWKSKPDSLVVKPVEYAI